LAIGAFSGCISAPASAPSDAGASGAPAESVAPPGQFDESTGAISGIVTDPELVPIAGATLGIQPGEETAMSALDGSFSFSRLAPGDYALLAGALGYN